jgi:hypothetical protein
MEEEQKIRLKALLSAIQNISVYIEDLKIERNLLLNEFRTLQPVNVIDAELHELKNEIEVYKGNIDKQKSFLHDFMKIKKKFLSNFFVPTDTKLSSKGEDNDVN